NKTLNFINIFIFFQITNNIFPIYIYFKTTKFKN
ncbi:hypothetical protein, partial [Plasmodium yoelii yoelii]